MSSKRLGSQRLRRLIAGARCSAATKPVGDPAGNVTACFNERGPNKHKRRALPTQCPHNVPPLSVVIPAEWAAGKGVGARRRRRGGGGWQFPLGRLDARLEDIGTFLFWHLACDKISETFRAEFDPELSVWCTFDAWRLKSAVVFLLQCCQPSFVQRDMWDASNELQEASNMCLYA